MRPFSPAGRREEGKGRERVDPRVGRGCVAIGGSGTSGRRCKKETGSSRYRGTGEGCGSRALPVATPLSRTLAKYTDPIDAKYPWLGANQNVVLAIRRTNE